MASDGGNGSSFSIVEEKPVSDTYTDSTKFEVSFYGVTLEFGQLRAAGGVGGQAQHIPRVRVHMSPQHAKVLAKLFVKNMKAYEQRVGEITIPREILDGLGLSEGWD